MRLWLQNILACPICKNHPLKLMVLEWDEPEMEPDDSELSRILKKDLEKNLISPPSMASIDDLTDSDRKQRVEELKNIFKNFGGEYNACELAAALGSKLEAVSEAIYRFTVKKGILQCGKCKRWFPIGSSIDGIPEMLPDGLRDKVKDQKFIASWRNKLPSEL